MFLIDNKPIHPDFEPDKLAQLWNIGASPREGSVQKQIIPQIPNYQIIKPLGEGGMGIIYLAEQIKPIKRQVALKVIKPGMDTRSVLSRFEAERQVLAMLEYPNIARIYDAGMTDLHLPYFAMEYVDGIPVTAYCDREKLSIKDRLRLFIQICQAIHHAHQKGIIHRDIKPSNILVTVQDGKPVPKIIDFGIAKAVSQHLTEQTIFTEQGQLIGTPEYMSPEQADLSNQDIDTRTDIYSLGILLYELLTGALPFETSMLRKAAFGEIQRIIREETPPRPSTRLSKLGNEIAQIVSNRKTELSTLVKSLHKELEWIPLMAIRKERDHRYKSAADFAQDVQNYLQGNPLIAGPESFSYRVKKYIKRNKIAVGAILSIVCILILGIIISSFFAVGQYVAKQEATTARIEAENYAREVKIAKDKETKERVRAERERQNAIQEAINAKQASYYNSIALADSAIKQNNIHNAKAVLENCPEELRNWEWYHLWNESDMSSGTIYGHMDEVTSVLLSDEAKYIFSGSLDGMIRQWDAETGKEVKSFDHKGKVSSIALSPNGRFIASNAIEAGRIKIWDASTGENIKIIYYNADFGANTIGFTSSGNLLVGHGLISSFNGNDWDNLYSFRTEHGYDITSISLHPSERFVATASKDGTVKVFDLLTKKQIMSFLENKGEIFSVTFNHSGNYIAYGGDVIKIWDFNNRKLLKVLDNHGDIIRSVTFSPQDNILASGSADNTIKLWDVDSGEEIITLHGHEDDVQSLAFSFDGKSLVSGSKDTTIKIWDIEKYLKFPDNILIEGKPVLLCVSVSPDGKAIAAGAEDGSIFVYNVIQGGVEKYKICDDSINSIAYSVEGEHIFCGSSKGFITISQASSGSEVHSFKGSDEAITSLSAYGNDKLLGGIENGEVKAWNLHTDEEILNLKAHKGPVTSIQTNSDGTLIVSAGEGLIKIWDVTSKALVNTLGNEENTVFTAKYINIPEFYLKMGVNDPNMIENSFLCENYILWYSQDGVCFWDLCENKSTFSSGGQDDTTIRDVSYSDDMTFAVKLNFDGEIEYSGSWGINDGKVIARRFSIPSIYWANDSKTVVMSVSENSARWLNLGTREESILPCGQGITNDIACCPVKSLIAYGYKEPLIYDGKTEPSNDLFVSIVNFETKRKISIFNTDRNLDFLEFSPQGNLIASTHGNEIRLWDVITGFEVQRYHGHSKYIGSIDFSPDGRYLVSGSVDKTVKLWDIDTGNAIITFSDHNGTVNTVSFSSDGKYIASGSDDKAIIIWEVETGNKIQEFHGHDGKIWSVSFNPDGTRIASGSSDRTLKLWSVEKGIEVLTIKDPDLEEITRVSYSPNGQYIAYGNIAGTIRLLDSATPEVVKNEMIEKNKMANLIASYLSQKSVKQTIPVYHSSNGGGNWLFGGSSGGYRRENLPPDASVDNICIDKDFKFFTGAWAMDLPCGLPNSVRLSHEPEELLIREPDYGSKKIHYGCFLLGNAEDNKFTFALDQIAGDEIVLYVDKNNNEDLTDDGGPYEYRGYWAFACDIDIEAEVTSETYESVTRPYNIWFWIKDDQGKLQAQYRSNCYYKGYVMSHLAIAYEHDNPDALYQDQGLWIDLNKDYMLDFKNEHFCHGDTITIGNKQYQLILNYP